MKVVQETLESAMTLVKVIENGRYRNDVKQVGVILEDVLKVAATQEQRISELERVIAGLTSSS